MMRVFVDQLSCTGAGQCELLVPEIFAVGDDGLATVKGPSRPDGSVEVPPALEARVRDAADVCPGACILLQD